MAEALLVKPPDEVPDRVMFRESSLVARPLLFQPGPLLRSVLLGSAKAASHPSTDARGPGVSGSTSAIAAPGK
jgi:hypothetical protein